MRKIFGHGRYATVTSTLALVVALSGTAYAAATVTSADIVNGTVQGLDIKTATVASADIKDGTVTATDLADGGILGADIANGTIGLADIGADGVDSNRILDGSVTTTDLADGSILGADIADGTIGPADIPTGGVDSTRILDGTVTPADHNASGLGAAPRLFAQVAYDGTLGTSNGVTGSTHPGTGVYAITFNQNIDGCVAQATPTSYGHVVSAFRQNATVHVEVQLLVGSYANHAFDLLVVC